LKKLVGYEDDWPEYEYYKIILEFLGINSYVLDTEIKNLKNNSKKR